MRGVLVLGGVIHGAFGTGGPFVVIHASKALTDKTHFRAAFSVLWVVLNTILLAKWTLCGDVWSAHIGALLAVALPFLVGGILLGDFLHYRVNERVFRMIVYAVLVLSGAAMLYSIA